MTDEGVIPETSRSLLLWNMSTFLKHLSSYSLETKHVLQGVPEVRLLLPFHNLQQMLHGVHVFLVQLKIILCEGAFRSINQSVNQPIPLFKS